MTIERLSIAQVATQFGVSVDTVRRRIRRGVLKAHRDNHGQWWVELDSEALPELAPPQPPADVRLAPAMLLTQPPSDAAAGLREQLAEARGELAGLREMLRVAEATAREATGRAERAEAEAAEAWRTVADLARRPASPQSLAPVPPVVDPTLPQRRGWLRRLLR